VKGHDGSLAPAISVVDKVIGEVNTRAKQVEREIHAACEKLREMVNEREAQLLSEVETVRHEKEKELVSQKHYLEFLLIGIRESTQFGEVLVKEGGESEIVASQKEVVSRLTTLGQEKEKSQMEPTTDSTIAFEEDAGGLGQVGEVITAFGSVVSKDISAEKSSIEGQPSGSVSVNQAVSFKVVVVDKKGNRMTSSPKRKGIIPFVVEISLNGKRQQQQQVKFEENQGKEGEFSVSFALTNAGQHQIYVSHKGRHFKGSPFRIEVVDRPVYCRDYNAVGTNPVLQFGSDGSGDGQFGGPCGVACNSRGDIVVVDYGNDRVQVFDKAGKFLFKFGSNGKGTGQFSALNGVTIDQRNSQIVVADGSNHRVQVFDEKGGFIRAFGSRGSGDGQLNNPFGVVVDSRGNYFVAEYGSHRVSVFDSNGQFLRKFGSEGKGNGQLSTPEGIDILSNGHVVIGEYDNDHVSIFDSQGDFVRHVGVDQLSNPWYLFVDSDDNILVADSSNNRVLVFKADGSLVKTIDSGKLSCPAGVCMDSEGRIIVCENGADRISIF